VRYWRYSSKRARYLDTEVIYLRVRISRSTIRVRWGSSYNIVRTLVKLSKVASSDGIVSPDLLRRSLSGVNQVNGGSSRRESIYITLTYSLINIEGYPVNFNRYLTRNGRMILRSPENIGGLDIFDSWDLEELTDLVSSSWIRLLYSRTID
jgi:hypothetical protein